MTEAASRNAEDAVAELVIQNQRKVGAAAEASVMNAVAAQAVHKQADAASRNVLL